MEAELKLCSFCGGEAETKSRNYCVDMQFDDDHDEFWCECKECGARGKIIHIRNARYKKTCKEELKLAEEQSIRAWNRRCT